MISSKISSSRSVLAADDVVVLIDLFIEFRRMTLKSRSVSSALVKYSKIAAALALSVGMFHGVQAQESAKIGFVRTDRVINESNLAKAILAKLDAEFSKREKELQAIVNENKEPLYAYVIGSESSVQYQEMRNVKCRKEYKKVID